MKRLVVPVLILIVAFFAFPQSGAMLGWFLPLHSLKEMQHQAWFDSGSIGNVFRFQSPSMSPFSIPYLTIKEVREDALLLQGINPQSIPRK